MEHCHPDAASRVIQGVLTGIGFLGAGVIIRRESDQMPHGLTTAAAVWVTAALGCAAGLGQWRISLIGTALALALLVLDHSVERWLQQQTDDQSSERNGSRSARGGESGDSSGT